MDVAALSLSMSQVSLSQQVGVAVAKMAIDSANVNSIALTKMMEQRVNPNLGRKIDLKV